MRQYELLSGLILQKLLQVLKVAGGSNEIGPIVAEDVCRYRKTSCPKRLVRQIREHGWLWLTCKKRPRGIPLWEPFLGLG